MVATFRIDDVEYVILPKTELDILRGVIPEGSVEAVPYAIKSIARALRVARQTPGLTQAQLAAKLHKSQAMVSAAENGRVRVGERYVKAVLRACGLPADWKPPAEPANRKGVVKRSDR